MKVLVVDDEPEVLKVTKTALESLGYEVLALDDSRVALDSVDRERFRAAFVDARMPHVDGFALIRHIRNSPSNSTIPVVMLTGFDDVETMRAAFKAGVTFFQPKPIDVKKLMGLLRTMQGAMPKEKRACGRLPLQNIVACRAGQYGFKALGRDISEGGMLLQGARDVSEGEKLDLRFSLPGIQGILNLRATVVRVEGGDRTAVRFVSLGPEQLKMIQAYIAGSANE